MIRHLVWFTGWICAAASAATLQELNAEADAIHGNGKTALMMAARSGDNERIATLISQGARVGRTNDNGGTVLMYGALSGNTDTVRLLIQLGADIDAAAKNGWTALMIATAKGYVEIATLLLDSGASPNAADIYNWTPLMRAVFEGREQTVELLLSRPDLNVNQSGENGLTALHLAVLGGHARITGLLVGSGADPDARDGLGRTPRGLAASSSNTALSAFMDTSTTGR